MELSGSPKTVFEVGAKQVIPQTPSNGIGILQGPLSRGKIGKAHFVRSSVEFTRNHGDDIAGYRFPQIVKRLLDAGCKLWIIRAGHYTDPTDKSTLAGTKASATITISSNNSVWNADEVGAGYNGTTIVVASAASGDANKKDITITMKGSDISIYMKDVKRAMSAGEISDFNAALKTAGAQVVLVSIATQIENGTGTLASGAQDVSAIIAADYTGNANAANGWFVADKVMNAMRIANLGLVGDEDVDEGLRAYVNKRMDMRYYIGTPLGVNSVGAIAYRSGTSPYSNAAANDWLGDLITGDVTVVDPANKNLTFDIPGVVDVFGRRLITDAKKKTQDGGQFRSHAGLKNGVVKSPNLGVPYNLGSPGLSTEFDNVSKAGINAIIEDYDESGSQVVYWGNETLILDPGSLLRNSNIADGIMYMIRTLRPLVRVQMFDPNDVVMWKAMYRKVKPSLDSFETDRIIVPGEYKNWFWQGDQDVDKREDAIFNPQSELDAGKYMVRFVFIPINATKFIGIQMAPTDSNSVKYVVTEL